MFEHLYDYKWGNDEDLLSLGFERWDEESTDSERGMEFRRSLTTSYEPPFGHFNSDAITYELRLRVRFMVCISDDPYVSTSENFDYSFGGVFLQVVEEDHTRPVTEFETLVRTMSELRALIASFTHK
jgi:hypothetical protein